MSADNQLERARSRQWIVAGPQDSLGHGAPWGLARFGFFTRSRSVSRSRRGDRTTSEVMFESRSRHCSDCFFVRRSARLRGKDMVPDDRCIAEGRCDIAQRLMTVERDSRSGFVFRDFQLNQPRATGDTGWAVPAAEPCIPPHDLQVLALHRPSGVAPFGDAERNSGERRT